jgi:hypothetical protein
MDIALIPHLCRLEGLGNSMRSFSVLVLKQCSSIYLPEILL